MNPNCATSLWKRRRLTNMNIIFCQIYLNKIDFFVIFNNSPGFVVLPSWVLQREKSGHVKIQLFFISKMLFQLQIWRTTRRQIGNKRSRTQSFATHSLEIPLFTNSLLHNKHPVELWHLNSILHTSAGKFLLQLNSAGALEPDTYAALCTDTSRCSELRVIVTVLPWYPGGSACDLEVRGHRSGGQQQRKEVLFSGLNVTVFEWQSRNVNMFIF